MMVRKARGEDADDIARIYVQCWRDSYAGLIPDEVLVGMSRRRQAAEWRRSIARQFRGHRILVAEGESGNVLGFGSCGPARKTALAYRGEVYTLYVDPDRRGEGIGKALLRALFGTLTQDSMGSALVWVLAANPARFFYESLGGRFIAVREEKLWGTVLPQMAYGWDDLASAAGGRAEHPASRPE